jgi:hypothetical protein
LPGCGKIAAHFLPIDDAATLGTQSQMSSLWQLRCLSPQDAPLQALVSGIIFDWSLFLHELQ